MTSLDGTLTIPDVANLFKVTEETVYGLVQKRDLPGFRVGGQWQFRRTPIDSWIDTETDASEAPPVSSGAKPPAPSPEK